MELLYSVYRMQDTLTRTSLAEAAAERIRGWILDGRLSPDDALTEPGLASLLGISRTPLRSAITRLAHEGLLAVEPGKGFRVTRVDASLVREIYPIIAALEGMALRLSAPDSLPDVAALEDVNDQIDGEKRRTRLFELDREFHRLLAAGCPDARLLDLLEHHRRLAQHVDGAARRGMHRPRESAKEHAQIIEDIAHRRVERAVRRIEQHYLHGIEVVIDWMSTRGSEK